MRHKLTIGVVADTIEPVTSAIRGLTGWTSEAHDSSYLGEYDLFREPEKVMVKYNFVPSEDEWDFPDSPEFAILIVVGETQRPEFFRTLASKLGLETQILEDASW